MGASESSVSASGSTTVNHPVSGKQVLHKETGYNLSNKSGLFRPSTSLVPSHQIEVNREQEQLAAARDTALGLQQQQQYAVGLPPYQAVSK